MSEKGSNKRVANSLLALSSAAVLAVYAAGYERTRSAANRFSVQAEERRPAIPVPAPGPPNPPSGRSPSEPGPPKPKGEGGPPATPTLVPKPTPARIKPRAPVAAAPPKTADVLPSPSPVAAEPVLPAATPPVVAAPPQPPPPVVPPAKPVYKDGTYLGWGTSRHGDIQAEVVIEEGRIKAATIAQCLTRYSCNVISNLPPQVAARQSPETDYVSGATQSTNAFYYAVVDALSKAK